MLNTAVVLESADFLVCDRELVLASILKMDKFSCNEAKVFEAMMSWVKAKSEQDAVTMDLVKYGEFVQ